MNAVEEKFGFKRFRAPFGNGTLDIYVSSPQNEFKKKKPLFLYVISFGPVPIFKKTAKGISNCLFLPPELLNTDYYYAVIAYPGVPFLSDGEPQENAEYTDAADLGTLAGMYSAAIDFLVGQEWVDSGKVVVCGASSGADIAAKVAAINSKVTQLGCFAGCGLTQMHNFVTHIRKKVHARELDEATGEQEISSLLSSFRDIFSAPDAKDKHWGGHTYKLWHSFFNEPPVESLLRLNIPIFYAKGTEDASSGIEGTDIIPLEFIRHGKTNLTYKVLWGCDHSFNKVFANAKSETTRVGFHDSIVADFINWLKMQI